MVEGRTSKTGRTVGTQPPNSVNRQLWRNGVNVVTSGPFVVGLSPITVPCIGSTRVHKEGELRPAVPVGRQMVVTRVPGSVENRSSCIVTKTTDTVGSEETGILQTPPQSIGQSVPETSETPVNTG